MNSNLRRYMRTASSALGMAAVVAILAGMILVNGRTPLNVCSAALAVSVASPLFALVAIVLGHICRNRTGWILGYASLVFLLLLITSFGLPPCGEHFGRVLPRTATPAEIHNYCAATWNS